MIYFDNAATSYPKPHQVAKAANMYFSRFGANPGRGGYKMSLETAEMVYSCRESICRLVRGQSTDHVVFTQNCTHALNLAIKGVMLGGGHMIISDLEHNSVARPAQTLADQGIAEFSIAKTYNDDDRTVQSFKSLIRSDTKLIACTHASNVFGYVLPVERIARVAHENGALMLVDAAQSAGVLDIDVSRMGIDFLCAAGHKGLMGPTGTGVLITSKGDSLRTIMEGGTGSSSIMLSQPEEMPERMESGTVNTLGICMLKAGVDYVISEGTTGIYGHELELIRYIYDNLSNMKGVMLYTGKPSAGKYVPVLSFNVEGMPAEETVERLARMNIAVRGGLHCSPLAHTKMGTLKGGTVRVSTGSSNNFKEAGSFCRAIHKILLS